MVVGVVLEIAVLHQVIGRDKGLRSCFADVLRLSDGGAGEGDTLRLRAVAPNVKECVVDGRRADGQRRVQTEGQYSQ